MSGSEANWKQHLCPWRKDPICEIKIISYLVWPPFIVCDIWFKVVNIYASKFLLISTFESIFYTCHQTF